MFLEAATGRCCDQTSGWQPGGCQAQKDALPAAPVSGTLMISWGFGAEKASWGRRMGVQRIEDEDEERV